MREKSDYGCKETQCDNQANPTEASPTGPSLRLQELRENQLYFIRELSKVSKQITFILNNPWIEEYFKLERS